jgi:tetratricopeptide (TPR) repeat protein
MLIRISLDPRLRYTLPANFDARAAVEKDLAHLRDVAASHPGSLNVTVTIARRLRLLGRGEEALSTLEAVRPDGPQGATFTDLDRARNWWWDGMAHAYAFLGRYEDAVTAFRAGIDAKENGGANISQTFNLAALQVRFGHHAEALKTLAAFDASNVAPSTFGWTVYRLVRGCARYQTGDIAGAKADRDASIANEKDSPRNFTDLLLCMGDVDGAAAAMIRRLDNTDERVDALLQLSDFDPPAHPVTTDPGDLPMAELKKRKDIKEAIARAGGTRRFALQADML